MSKCLNCKAPLKQSKGKRAKKYCNSTCRSNHWQKLARQKLNETIENKPPTGQVLTMDEVVTANIKLTKHLADNKPSPTLVTLKSVQDDLKPKTLKELKEMVPVGLTGLDKSAWIAKKRTEYGI